MNAAVADRFAGCLLGLAIGGAMGAGCADTGGPEALEAYLADRRTPAQARLVRSTAVAGLAMATARALISAGRVEGPELVRAYLVWFRGDGGVIGQSTWLALRRLQRGVPWTEAGDSGRFAAGAAPAARIAPVGLLHTFTETGLKEDVRTCGTITHRNEEALAGALAVAHAVARGARGVLHPTQLCLELQSILPSGRCRDALYRARATWEAGVPVTTALRGLGQGGAVFEAVGAALYCCLCGEWDPERVILMAALGGGDAGARGAIAGAIVGAAAGKNALPAEWVAQLWEAPLVEDTAEQLLMLALAGGGEANWLSSVGAPA